MFNNGSVTQQPETVPADTITRPRNLAEALHEGFVHLWHELSGPLARRGVDWEWAIGQRVLPVGFGDDVEGARVGA